MIGSQERTLPRPKSCAAWIVGAPKMTGSLKLRRGQSKVCAGRIELTDARLEELADRFINFEVRLYTGTAFEDYIKDPDGFDHITRHLKAGGALQFFEGSEQVFTLHA